VGEPGVNEVVGAGRVKKVLEVRERRRHLRDRRGDEARLPERRAAGTDPVLGGSELARSGLGPPTAAEQFPVDLSDQSQRERKIVEALEAVVHRGDVIHDVAHVAGGPPGVRFELHLEKVFERALSALDL